MSLADGIPQRGDLIYRCDRVNGDDDRSIQVFYDSNYIVAGNYGIRVDPSDIDLLASDTEEDFSLEVNGESTYLLINKTSGSISAVSVHKDYASAQQFRNCQEVYKR